MGDLGCLPSGVAAILGVEVSFRRGVAPIERVGEVGLGDVGGDVVVDGEVGLGDVGGDLTEETEPVDAIFTKVDDLETSVDVVAISFFDSLFGIEGSPTSCFEGVFTSLSTSLAGTEGAEGTLESGLGKFDFLKKLTTSFSRQ